MLGVSAQPTLEKVLEGRPSLETRRRVEKVLENIAADQLPPEMLRMLPARSRCWNTAAPPKPGQVLEKLRKGPRKPDKPRKPGRPRNVWPRPHRMTPFSQRN